MIKKLVLASGNLGKIAEFQSLLSHQQIEVHSQSEFNVSDADETGTTFIENAIIKARHAAKISKLPTIADDSGLVVDALNGQPGVYSARYAGLPSDDLNNTNKLLQALKSVPEGQRSARFHCVMVFLSHANDPTPLISHGIWEGSIAQQPSGKQGFGYDPVFFIADKNRTSAELSAVEKNTLSHRGQAVRQLLPQILDHFSSLRE